MHGKVPHALGTHLTIACLPVAILAPICSEALYVLFGEAVYV